MPGKLKVWILLLALLGLVAPRLIGADAHIWHTIFFGGGPGSGMGGAVNLPCGKVRNTVARKAIGCENTVYDIGYRLPIPSKRLTLNLPSNMSNAMAVLTSKGVPLTFESVSDAIMLNGADLRRIRDAGITSFGVILVSPENVRLRLRFEFDIELPGMKLLVR